MSNSRLKGNFIVRAVAITISFMMLGGCASEPQLAYESATTEALMDLDSDGVINARDLCAETVIGAKVDNDGCAEKITNVLTVNFKLLFDNDSSYINKKYYPELERFAAMINESKGLVIELEGHASTVGKANYNLALSSKRANRVKSALVEKYNVNPAYLSVVAFGESKLAMLGDNESQHSLNRRVVAYIQVSNEVDLLRWNIYTTENK